MNNQNTFNKTFNLKSLLVSHILDHLQRIIRHLISLINIRLFEVCLSAYRLE